MNIINFPLEMEAESEISYYWLMTALDLNNANVKCFFKSDFAVHFLLDPPCWKFDFPCLEPYMEGKNKTVHQNGEEETWQLVKNKNIKMVGHLSRWDMWTSHGISQHSLLNEIDFHINLMELSILKEYFEDEGKYIYIYSYVSTIYILSLLDLVWWCRSLIPIITNQYLSIKLGFLINWDY